MALAIWLDIYSSHGSPIPIRLRCCHRFAEVTPNDLTLSRRRLVTGEAQWTVSITLRVPEALPRLADLQR